MWDKVKKFIAPIGAGIAGIIAIFGIGRGAANRKRIQRAQQGAAELQAGIGTSTKASESITGAVAELTVTGQSATAAADAITGAANEVGNAIDGIGKAQQILDKAKRRGTKPRS